MNPRKWLITGGCGFIGRTLISNLLKNNLADSIRIVDNLSVGTRDDLSLVTGYSEPPLSGVSDFNESGVELIVSDIRNSKAAISCAKGADVIVHLAANTGVQPSITNPVADMEVNVIGTVNYLEAARKQCVEKFIFASSGAPIGDAEPPIHEKLACRPISPYGASKLAGEAYCSSYHGSFGVDTIALRFSNVYGPLSGKKGSVAAKFIKLALEGAPWIINGSGHQTRDFIYSEDLARAIVAAAKLDRGGELFQIATQKELTINEFAKELATVIETVTERGPRISYGKALTGDVARNYADITHAREVLGWSPEVDLISGLTRTVEWFVRPRP